MAKSVCICLARTQWFDNWILILVAYGPNNTYKALRMVGKNYNLYYSVWCTNEHELYDLTASYPFYFQPQLLTLWRLTHTKSTTYTHRLTPYSKTLFSGCQSPRFFLDLMHCSWWQSPVKATLVWIHGLSSIQMEISRHYGMRWIRDLMHSLWACSGEWGSTSASWGIFWIAKGHSNLLYLVLRPIIGV